VNGTARPSKLTAALDKEVHLAAQPIGAGKPAPTGWRAFAARFAATSCCHPISRATRGRIVVTLLPSGEVLDLRLAKSAGHAALDAAIERAIRKSDPLPKPEKSDVFQRELLLKYRPRED
jgi:TonB family protein